MTEIRRDGPGARRFASARRKRIAGASPTRIDDAGRREQVREAVIARDRRCVLDSWQGAEILDLHPVGRTWIVPACGGRLEFGHRRHASSGGAYIEANGWAECHAHNQWIEAQPDAARAIGGETPWWLVIREGDPEWTAMGRKAAGHR